MGDDVIFAKPSFLGFGVDLRAWWRRLAASGPTGPAAVASRFIRLFLDHGVAENQIPQLIPSIGLHHLTSQTQLLSALTSDVLEKACRLFGVRLEWLRCVDDRMYDTRWSYKCPENFFKELAALKSPAEIAPVRAFATENMLDSSIGVSQRIELVLVEDVAQLGEMRVERYTPLSDGRDWACQDHRIELKSIIRCFGEPVPLYKASRGAIESLYEGRIIPRKLVNKSLLTNPSLEDWCMSESENWHAKEIQELKLVISASNLLRMKVAGSAGTGQPT